MVFDNENTKLLGWGESKFFVFIFKNQKMTVCQIQTDVFESILCLNYTTMKGRKRRDQCILVCKCVGKLQLIVFDYFDKDSNEMF